MGNRDGPLSVCNLPGDYAGFPGCGLLRLHSTYRHDLKIYASDEGRVQMTAAAFAKVIQTIADGLQLWTEPTEPSGAVLFLSRPLRS